MKKLIITCCLALFSLAIRAQTILRISANSGCVLVKNMTSGQSYCGKLEFSDKVSYIELRFGNQIFSSDISELKDASGVSLGATNTLVMQALGLLTNISAPTIGTLTTKMNANATDTSIPSTFRGGFIQWINPTVGTATLTCPTGSIALTGDAVNFPPIGNAQYGGFGIILTGGANIKWSLNY